MERQIRTQALKGGSRILGNIMQAKGMHMIMQPTRHTWAIRTANYVSYDRPLSKNEQFLSRAHYERFKNKPNDPRFKNEGFTHKPRANERLTVRTSPVRTRDGKGFEQSRFDSKRSAQLRARTRIKGVLLYRTGKGLPVLGIGLAMYYTYQDYQMGRPMTSEQKKYDLLGRTPQGSVLLSAEAVASQGIHGGITSILTGGNFDW